MPPRRHWFDTDFRPCDSCYIARVHGPDARPRRNTVPAATCIRTSSGRYRSISGETLTTALSLERRCAARTRRFLSAVIPVIDSRSTQSATTPPSSLSGRNGIDVVSSGADLGARPLEISSFLKGGPIGLRLRALREQRRLTGYPFFSYAGRGARTSNDRGQDPHHNQRGQAPFAKLKEPVPIIEKYCVFPLKSWFHCQ